MNPRARIEDALQRYARRMGGHAVGRCARCSGLLEGSTTLGVCRRCRVERLSDGLRELVEDGAPRRRPRNRVATRASTRRRSSILSQL